MSQKKPLTAPTTSNDHRGARPGLKRETLRRLDERELDGVGGGGPLNVPVIRRTSHPV